MIKTPPNLVLLILKEAITWEWPIFIPFWSHVSLFLTIITILAVIIFYFTNRILKKEAEKNKEQTKKLASGLPAEKKLSHANIISDQLFSAHSNRFSLLTSIGLLAAALLAVSVFGGNINSLTKAILSVLLLIIAIALYGYAFQMDLLIKRGEAMTEAYGSPMKYDEGGLKGIIYQLPTFLSIFIAVLIIGIIVVIIY